MTPAITAALTVLFQWAGLFVGIRWRGRLPDHHLKDDSREVVKTASGMIATLVALVIGLLVSSAKSSYDQANDGLNQLGAKLILLDRALSRYGDGAAAVRQEAKQSLERTVGLLWPTALTSAAGSASGIAAVERATTLDDVQTLIEQLEPQNERQTEMRTQALQLCGDLASSRWLIIEKAETTLPVPFLVMLICWLTLLFTSLGLLTPANPVTITSLGVATLSMAGALFLIMEMNRPFDGLIQASPAPLLKAIAMMP